MPLRGGGGIPIIASFAKWSIWAVTAGIAVVFAGVTLKDIPFVEFSRANPAYLQSILLSFYIACWAAGTTIDTKVQSSVYLIDPRGGRVRVGSVIAVAAIAIFSIAVLLTRTNELLFCLALTVFVIVDTIAWSYLKFIFLPPIIDETRKQYLAPPHRDYYGVIVLDIVKASVVGNWKWWRQLVLFAIVLSMILIALLPSTKDAISSWIESRIAGIQPGSIKLQLPNALLFLCIAISELWIFSIRLKAAISIGVLNELEDRFSIQPKS